jgi:hypothetical protein
MQIKVNLTHAVLSWIAPYLDILQLHRIYSIRLTRREQGRDEGWRGVDFLIMGLISKLLEGEFSIYKRMKLLGTN